MSVGDYPNISSIIFRTINKQSIIKSLSRKKNIIVKRAYHSRWKLCIGDLGLDDFFIFQIGKLGSDLIEAK